MFKEAIEGLTSKAGETISRFPVPCLFSLLFTVVFIAIESQETIFTRWDFIIQRSLFCGVFWFVSLKLFAESMKWSLARYYIIGIIGFLAIILELWPYNNQDFIPVPFGLLGAGLFLAVFVAPFLVKKSSNEEVWAFNNQLWSHLCFTILAAVISFILIAFIPATIEFLFAINFEKEIYIYIWIVITAFCSPIVAMAGIPNKYNLVEKNYSRALKAILTYIILPILYVYLVILYGYIIKIIVTWSLPKGGVVFPTSIFSIIGIIAYLASYPLRNVSMIIRLYNDHFFKILLPILALLAVAIGVRIYEYGITEDRYLIMLALVWFILSAFFALKKDKKNSIKSTLISVVVLFSLASFGPWGAVSLSASSQIGRLKALLEQNHILVDGRIQSVSQEINLDDRVKISSIIDYLVKTKKNEEIKNWFVDLPNAKNLSFAGTEQIMNNLGVKYASSEEDKARFVFNKKEKSYINVSGYDYLVEMNLRSESEVKNLTLGDDGPRLSIKFDLETNQITISINEKDDIVFSLNELVKQDRLNQLKELVLIEKNSNISVKLSIQELDGKIDQDSNKPIISYINAIFLIKLLN